MSGRGLHRRLRIRRKLANDIQQAAAELPNDAPTDSDLPVGYIGLAGYNNLGDDAMFEAVQNLLPGVSLAINPTRARAIMLGGGTLLNAGRYYLNRLRRVEGEDLPFVMCGTGVRSLDYWGATEDLAGWIPFVERAGTVGVRGPESETWLRSMGFEGSIEIVGDPALSLERPDHAKLEGHVVVAPLNTGGELHGGDDTAVLTAMGSVVTSLRNAGHPVTLMASHPNDDRWVLEMIRSVGDLGIDYVAGYADVSAALRTIASAELVIGERLHASVLAAAMETAFVPVEYRPKVSDFAKSVSQSDVLVRTDEVGRLADVVATVWDERRQRSAEVAKHVAMYRERQRTLAATFLNQIGS